MWSERGTLFLPACNRQMRQKTVCVTLVVSPEALLSLPQRHKECLSPLTRSWSHLDSRSTAKLVTHKAHSQRQYTTQSRIDSRTQSRSQSCSSSPAERTRSPTKLIRSLTHSLTKLTIEEQSTSSLANTHVLPHSVCLFGFLDRVLSFSFSFLFFFSFGLPVCLFVYFRFASVVQVDVARERGVVGSLLLLACVVSLSRSRALSLGPSLGVFVSVSVCGERRVLLWSGLQCRRLLRRRFHRVAARGRRRHSRTFPVKTSGTRPSQSGLSTDG